MIKLLMAEDVGTDAELEVRKLKAAGLDVDHRVVDTAAAFRREILEFRPDIILSDYSMPQFLGLDALVIARELCPDTPFIFVSGSLGEDVAVRALKDGASDYVLKNNLLRLPAAVERALQEARERAARRLSDEALLEANVKLQAIFDAAPVAIVGLDLEGRVMSWNVGAHRLFGWTAEEVVGRSCPTVPQDGLADFHAMIDSVLRDGPLTGSVRLRQTKDGRQIQSSLSAAHLRDAAGSIDGIMVILEDVTERMEQRDRIARLSRIRDVLSGVNSALLRVRERQQLFDIACRIAVETGGFQCAWVGTVDRQTLDVQAVASAGDTGALAPLKIARISAREDDESGQGIVGRSIRTGQVVVCNDIATDPNVRFREDFICMHSLSKACFPLKSEDTVIGVLALTSSEKGFFDLDEVRLLREVSHNIGFALELIEKQEKVNYLANYDVLTGLQNRELFKDRLGQALAVMRGDGGTLSLMLFDIEHFKLINDTLGVPGGDELLRQVARRLRERSPDASRLTRLGSDRFAVMTPSVDDASVALRTLRKGATRFLDQPFVVDGRELRIAAKAGIALFPEDGGDADTLFRNAEAALKRSKESGDSYRFYAPQINARVAEQLDLENRLRKAIEQEQFVLHYQPKVDLQSRRVVGLEALVRWNDPERGLVAPGTFIPILEQTGMILQVGQWALEETARTWRAWRERGLNPPRIAVNVSASQLRRDDWVESVRRAIALCGNGECGLDLEITESLLMENVEAVIVKLDEVRKLGVRIFIDDFGTGYSSLSYIGRLPVDALKIDRSFVVAMTAKADDASLVAAIIMIAHSLRLKVIAEGVETEEQAQMLRMLLCDEMQGWLTGKAMTTLQIEALPGILGTAA
jgi:diguanylate cyclase (GGDEF)-like protein/PAS domain S-box-containing protein